MDITDIIKVISSVIDSIINSPAAAICSIVGLILLILAGGLAYFAIKTPNPLPRWYSPAFSFVWCQVPFFRWLGQA